ncbi:MAG: tetratricopeptide repeat protein [Candidatus Competibacteraceae bacterium]|nr:tetratricopeptide repeat protein [Candidatus Competibacteraceae bacterium]
MPKRSSKRKPGKSSKPSKPKSLSIPEALKAAIQLQRTAQLDDAETLYRRILQAVPEQPDALHFFGVLHHQKGKTQEAAELIRRSLTINPKNASAQSNLGNVLKELKQFSEAETAYREAIALQPDLADAHNNLGTMLRLQNKSEAAVSAYRQAIELAPKHADAYHNLGNALVGLKEFDEAVEIYRQAIQLNPGQGKTYERLGMALYRLGRNDEAIAVFRQWQKADPLNLTAAHLLAACSGENVPTRASDQYVEELFDRLATSFDDHLHDLEYHAPDLVAGLVAEQYPDPSPTLSVLDAGCGTGLAAQLLRPYAERLVGVDLSAGMLDQARERGGYDELVQAELTAYLEQCAASCFDLIVSVDTLVYFGDLCDFLNAAAVTLKETGRLIFTVEQAEGAVETDQGYRLNPHGRYSHAEPYLRQTLENAGLTVRTIRGETLRLEGGWPVSGWLVLAEK